MPSHLLFAGLADLVDRASLQPRQLTLPASFSRPDTLPARITRVVPGPRR